MRKNLYAYVSSWMPSGVPFGIGIYEIDPVSGTMKPIGALEPDRCINMMFPDRENGILYAVDGMDRQPGGSAGGGTAFVYAVDHKTGMLAKRRERPVGCSNPFYISVNRKAHFAVVACHGGKSAITQIEEVSPGSYMTRIAYDDAAVELFEIEPDGSIGNLRHVDKHYGSGPSWRQLTAHPHCAELSPDGKWIACCDKGNDTFGLYAVSGDQKLTLPYEPVKCEPGFMPRYCVFHPALPYVYVNGEGSTAVNVYHYSPDGRLTFAGTYDAELPSAVHGEGVYEGQGICMHPSGKYLYNVCRGLNEVTVFSVSPADGSLCIVQHFPVMDSWPRGCAVSPRGDFLLITLMASGHAALLRITENGTLADTGAVCPQKFASNAVIW